MRIVFILVGVFSVSSALADENYRAVDDKRYQDWATIRLIDIFDETEVAWIAFHGTSSGTVAFFCKREGHSRLVASPGDPLTSTISSQSDKRPLSVRIRVDDNPVIETQGHYPHVLVGTGVDTDDVAIFSNVLGALAAGQKARIRTRYGAEVHTFFVSLLGFEDAAMWVFRECRD